jgi:DUF2075 family protein
MITSTKTIHVYPPKGPSKTKVVAFIDNISAYELLSTKQNQQGQARKIIKNNELCYKYPSNSYAYKKNKKQKILETIKKSKEKLYWNGTLGCIVTDE